MHRLIYKTINPSRVSVARFYVIVISVWSIFLGQQDYRSGYILMASAYGLLVVLGPASVILSFRVQRLLNLPAYVVVGFTFITFVIGSFTQLDSTAHLIWIPASPIMFFYLTNLRIGLVLTIVSYVILLVGYDNFAAILGKPPVSEDIFYQANAAYFFTAALSYFYEADRDKRERKLFQQSEYDVLTKILNRRGFGRELDDQLKRFERYNTSFSIILCDLDNFKQINDRFGHAIGDRVLIDVVGLIERNLRRVDTVGRWGGEEFIILANTTTANDAQTLAEKLRLAVEQHEFDTVKKLTASFGVAEIQTGDTVESLFNRADKALYDAKKTKNAVKIGVGHF